MACRQLIAVTLGTGSTSTVYIGVDGGAPAFMASAIGTNVQWSGSYKNFTFVHASDPGASKSFTYTLFKNGVSTGIAITINSSNFATGGSSTSSVSVIAGDRLYWQRTVTGVPTTSRVHYSCEFDNSVAFNNGYSGILLTNQSQTWHAPLFQPASPSIDVSPPNENQISVVAANGVLTALNYIGDVAPGVGATIEIALEINGVKQDGTGGTTDTRVSFTGASVPNGGWTGSIRLALGAAVSLRFTPTTSPAAINFAIAVTFQVDTDGESMISSTLLGQNLNTSGTNYLAPTNSPPSGFSISATESDFAMPAAIDTFVLKAFQVRLDTRIASSNGPCTWNARKNLATPTGAPSVTLSAGQQAGADLTGASMSITSGDTFDIQFVATGSPGGSSTCQVAFCVFATATAPAIKSAIALGYLAKVIVDKAMAVCLDGIAHTLSEKGKFKLWGNFEVTGATKGALGLATSGQGPFVVGLTPDNTINNSGTTISTWYTLNSLLIPANALSADGKAFAFEFIGITALNANTKDFRLSWGTHTFTLVSGSTGNFVQYIVRGTCRRLTVGAQKLAATIVINNALVGSLVADAVEDETTALTLALQSENSAAAAQSATGKGAIGWFLN